MPTRREVLAGLGALAIGCQGDPTDTAVDADPRTPEPDPWPGSGAPDDAAFPLGVQSGDPHPDGAVLWTKYAGTDAVALVVATWDGAWTAHAPVAVAVTDGFVHHVLTGVLPDTPVAFQFAAGGAFSRVGRLRTAIGARHTGTVTIGASSCCNHSHGDFPSLSLLAARYRMDAFLWLGDTVYADGDGSPPADLDGYRRAWADNLATEGFRSILASTPGVTTWDDHEVANNWDAETVDPDGLAWGRRAMFEHAAIRGDRLWRSMKFGRTAEVFVLDCRGERYPSRGEYLSPEQLAWLKEGLLRSDAVWKLVANSVPISDMPPLLDIARDDRWEGFPEQRDELLDHIVDNGITGVLFVSGDLHQSSLSRVDPTGPRRRILELQAGPSGSSFLGTPARLVEEGDQWVWSDAQWCADVIACHSDGTARIVAIDERDRVLFDGVIDVHGDVLSADIFHP